jgi:hypothetical protein
MADGKSIPALPVPVADAWRGSDTAGYPALGEANSLLDTRDKTQERSNGQDSQD